MAFSWHSFGVLLAASHEVQPPAWLPQEPSDLSGLDLDSPPWLAAKLPLSVSLGWLKYIIYCAFIVYSYFPNQFTSIPFAQLKIYFKCLFLFTFNS
jgi:hypothetical protein